MMDKEQRKYMTLLTREQGAALLRQIKGKTVTWEESFAPASDDPDWHPCQGTIISVDATGDGYFVEELDGYGGRRWITPDNAMVRDIRIVEGENPDDHLSKGSLLVPETMDISPLSWTSLPFPLFDGCEDM